ncbi:serine hydrolase domain-containing protein [Amycolatopsis dongchuanensis]|uniref:Serine hydrolase domain-containing protein n=1 Tax=Amycolatopsis dongchuanensis TaxID=1070866 RepID=A0ABP9R651_9PSEU
MVELDEIRTWAHERLPDLLARHQVPGAALAVSAGEEVVETAAGVLNTATGVAATADSVFQVGSITKVWTTTLAMQLVDEGKLDIDAPVRRYLPEFALADEEAAARITVRQLMCHVSGFGGDSFTDTGPGDDCVEKYVAALRDAPQLFPPGEMFSYNNAAFCVLGRIVEVLRDKSYDDCLRDHLCAPLRLTHTATGPAEAIRYRAAVGHIRPGPDAEPQPAPVWALTRSNAPAGAVLSMRPRDLLTFARMHLVHNTVLSEAGAQAMRERQVTLPEPGPLAAAWGLGWQIFDLPAGTVIGHNGGTIGQAAYLRVVPAHDVGVALFTNGGTSYLVYQEIVGRVLRDLTGIELPPMPLPEPHAPRIDASRYIGTYASPVTEAVVSQDDDGRVWLARTPKGAFASGLGETPVSTELVAWSGDTLLAVEPEPGPFAPHTFLGDDGQGHARYLYWRHRLIPRVA